MLQSGLQPECLALGHQQEAVNLGHGVLGVAPLPPARHPLAALVTLLDIALYNLLEFATIIYFTTTTTISTTFNPHLEDEAPADVLLHAAAQPAHGPQLRGQPLHRDVAARDLAQTHRARLGR